MSLYKINQSRLPWTNAASQITFSNRKLDQNLHHARQTWCRHWQLTPSTPNSGVDWYTKMCSECWTYQWSLITFWKSTWRVDHEWRLTSPRNVRVIPTGTPCLSLNPAIAFLERVTTDFWPVTSERSRTVPSKALAFLGCLPNSTIHHHLLDPRDLQYP